MGFCVAWGSVITRGAQPSSRGSEAGVGAGGHRTRSGTRPAWNPGQATWCERDLRDSAGHSRASSALAEMGIIAGPTFEAVSTMT